MNKKLKNNKGFTLVELIVVIAIIGILVAIAVPRFSGSLDRAKIAADEATAKAIQTAVGMYAMDNNGSFPATLDFSNLNGTGQPLYDLIGDVEYQTEASKFSYKDGVVTYTP